MEDGPGAFEALFALEEAAALGGRPNEACLLGLDEGVPHFVLPLHAAALAMLTERADLFVIDLRSIAVQGLVSAEEIGELATAKAMLASARAAHLLLQLRGEAHCRRGRLAARMPELRRAAFPAHRPGGDHAHRRRR